MHIQAVQWGWTVRSPAKVNLILDVLGKRPDGFHEIDTLMCPVSLTDDLEFRPLKESELRLELVVADRRAADSGGSDPAWDIPVDGRNLILKALLRVRDELGATGGCHVRLIKRVPAAAGLGGGSSNAAAAIAAGLLMWGSWNRELAWRIGAALGSDVPLFFGDERGGIGLARATGRGEHVTCYTGRTPLHLVITHPAVGSSTAEVYRAWKPAEINCSIESDMQSKKVTQASETDRVTDADSRQDAAHKHEQQRSAQLYAKQRSGRIERMLQACDEGNVDTIRSLMSNDLEEPAGRLNTWIATQRSMMTNLGLKKAMMTGSGSACYALVDSAEQAENAAARLIELGLPRAHAAEAWYAPPIEAQLSQQPRPNP
ncbi:MAG: 4-(cytidine 5'-diphospho)-2-C-methyl-D-erythritol kinase [Pirellulales bacterium]